MILREYQKNTLQYIKSYQGKRLCIVSPTGSGKSVIISNIINYYNSLNKKVFLLVHKNDLILQSSNHLNKLNVKHSIIGNKYIVKLCRLINKDTCWGYYSTYQDVAICSIQTLINRLDIVESPDVIIVDETHHACNNTYKNILNKYNNSIILGFTATPIRLDGKGLGSIYTDLYEVEKTSNLIKMGYLSKYKVYAPQSISLKGISKVGGDYNKKELLENVDKKIIYGDVIKEYQKHCNKLPTIAFCINIEHCKKVANLFNQYGYKAVALTSEIKSPVMIQKYIKQLGTGEIDILTSCEMISEGTDIPIVSCALMLRPTASFGLYRQMAGRVLRIAPNKEYSYILDFVGNVMRHGLPDDDIEWDIKDEIFNKKNKEKNKTDLVTCPNCFCLYSNLKRICPYCNFERPIIKTEIENKKEIELVEFNKKNLIEIENCKHITELKTPKDFYDYARAHNYKKGWAYIQMKRKGILK